MSLKAFKFILIIIILILFNCEKKLELSENALKLKSFLPLNNEVSGWKLKSALRFFQADNLWELINGAAEGYLVYGFKEMVTSEFINENTKQEMVIEIYQMKDNNNGFGIYSAERHPDNEFIDIGTQGYTGNMVLNFWKDKYYAKIIGFESSPEVQESLKDLANIIDKKIPEEKKMPEFISYFPQKGLIKSSEKFVSRDFLGHGFLQNGYIADYNIDNKEVKFFFIDCEDEQSAKSSYDKYKGFIGDSGKIVSEIKNIGDEGFVGEDRYYGIITVLKKDKIILGALGVANKTTGLNLIKEALSKIG
ncbi:MAG: hypothetical protein HWN67_05270 [Candidatus Helarchaeota archaeon]|nr:hypothetical protein [Candidatus Helarchaeota archaeon]